MSDYYYYIKGQVSGRQTSLRKQSVQRAGIQRTSERKVNITNRIDPVETAEKLLPILSTPPLLSARPSQHPTRIISSMYRPHMLV